MSEPRDTQDTAERALSPPRFTLRTLLIVMTLCGGLFALMSAIGALWSVGLLFFTLLIGGHVLGNSLGTRLRDGERPGPPPRLRENVVPALATVAPQRLAERTRLSRLAMALGLLGGVVGAFLGGMGSANLYPEAGPGAVTLGTLSAGVLGGLIGFAASSFVLVVRAAWREALGDSAQANQPPR